MRQTWRQARVQEVHSSRMWVVCSEGRVVHSVRLVLSISVVAPLACIHLTLCLLVQAWSQSEDMPDRRMPEQCKEKSVVHQVNMKCLQSRLSLWLLHDVLSDVRLNPQARGKSCAIGLGQVRRWLRILLALERIQQQVGQSWTDWSNSPSS